MLKKKWPLWAEEMSSPCDVWRMSTEKELIASLYTTYCGGSGPCKLDIDFPRVLCFHKPYFPLSPVSDTAALCKDWRMTNREGFGAGTGSVLSGQQGVWGQQWTAWRQCWLRCHQSCFSGIWACFRDLTLVISLPCAHLSSTFWATAGQVHCLRLPHPYCHMWYGWSWKSTVIKVSVPQD